LFTGACSVSQDLSLELSGRGTGRVEILLDPVLIEYLRDLSLVAGGSSSGEIPFFDAPAITRAFEESPGVDLIRLEIPRREQLILEFRFSDLNRPFGELLDVDLGGPAGRPGTGVRPLLSFTRRENSARWVFYLAADNFFMVRSYFPLADESLMDYFGPNPQNPVSEELYKGDLEMAFEEYLGGRSVDSMLEGARVSLRVRVEGEITRLEGGRRIPGGAVFETPLIRFLTLTNPIEYSLEFR
jgi:hypothetical protein